MSIPFSPDERSLPLSHLSVLLVGASAVGTLTAHLLASQGASIQTSADDMVNTLPDILIDATLRDNVETPQRQQCDEIASLMRDAGNGGVFVTFTGFPPGFPFPATTSESLINGVLGLEFLSDEQVTGQLPVASAYGAANASIEIMLSTLASAAFTAVEVPLSETVFTLLGRSLVTPEDPLVRDEMSGPRFPIAEIYECGDGRFIQCHGTTTRFSDGLCDALGHPEWKEAARGAMKSLENDQAVESWRALISEALGQMSAMEAQQRIVDHGGSATVCLDRSEWQNSTQARESGIFTRIKSEATTSEGDQFELGPAVMVRDSPSGQPATDRPAASRADRSQPLEGIRVIDLSIVLAGPTSARVLAEWGADVIKVDSPTRPVSPFSWIDVNRSKRSTLIDLTTPGGKQTLRDLIASADVIIENFRSGKLAALGFDYATVSDLKPNIIYASMNAFDFPGPMEHQPGWEHNAEALSGMQSARALNGVPQPVPYPVNDYLTGLLGAFGVLVALHHRDRTGLGSRVTGSLARSASFTQCASFGSAEQRTVTKLNTTVLVRCRDGTVVLEDQVPCDNFEIRTFREAALLLSVDEVMDRLAAVGVPSVVSLDIPGLFKEDRLASNSVQWQQSSAGVLRQAFTRHHGDYVGLGSPRFPAPEPGSDTVSVLTALGYDSEKIELLMESGAVASTRPLIAGR